jgi:Na+-driven multidrug efflux pump
MDIIGIIITIGATITNYLAFFIRIMLLYPGIKFGKRATGRKNLLTGSIPGHIYRLALPSIGGMLSFTIFNHIGTYFVFQLGTDALAAMGFTFSIVLNAGAVVNGISMGTASLLSCPKGAGNFHLMQRIAADGIILSLLFVLVISMMGCSPWTESSPFFMRNPLCYP